MKNLTDHIGHPCELVTSLLIRGNQMDEVSRLDWLIRLVTHATWVVSLYFLYLL
jgi:hypothetical protein